MSYIEYLKNKNFSENTIDSYMSDLNLFKESLGDKELNMAEKTDILRYLVSLKNEDYSNKTIARKIAALKSYYYYALNMGMVERDPTFQIESPKLDIKNTNDILDKNIVEDFLKLPLANDDKSLKAKRDYILFNLLFLTGINGTDLLDKKIRDIDFQLNCLKHKGKYVFVEDDIFGELKDYVGILEEKYPDNEYVFINRSGDKLTRQGAWKLFNTYSKKINQKITAQTLIDCHNYYIKED